MTGLIVDRLTTDEIAAALGLSPETVRSHVKHILRKLDARSREEAIETARCGSARRTRRAGSVNVEAVARAGPDMPMSPPCRSTILRQIVRPSPAPRARRSRVERVKRLEAQPPLRSRGSGGAVVRGDASLPLRVVGR